MTTCLGLVALAFLLAGCASGPSPSGLSRNVGRDVDLVGPLGGPGKAGFHVAVADGKVYLSDFTNAEAVPVGMTVLVTGRLQRYDAAPGACAKGADCSRASGPPYYFIEDAKVRIAP